MAYAEQAARFDNVKVPDEVRRKLTLLKLSLTLPAPSDAKEAAETTLLAAGLEASYGRGKYCPGGDASKCMTIDDVTKVMASSRDPKQLLEVWNGWGTVSRRRCGRTSRGGGAVQQRGQGTRVLRYRRAVAVTVRHAA